MSSYYEGKGKTVEEAATDAGKKAKRALKKRAVKRALVKRAVRRAILARAVERGMMEEE